MDRFCRLWEGESAAGSDRRDAGMGPRETGHLRAGPAFHQNGSPEQEQVGFSSEQQLPARRGLQQHCSSFHSVTISFPASWHKLDEIRAPPGERKGGTETVQLLNTPREVRTHQLLLVFSC